MPDPNRAEVFDWMDRMGAGALRAARHFAGAKSSDADVVRLHNRIKSWVRRSKGKPKAKQQVAKRAPNEPWESAAEVAPSMGVRVVHPSEPPGELADPVSESTSEFYARRLRVCESDIALAREHMRATLFTALLRQQADDRKALDQALEEEVRERAHLERSQVRDAEVLAAAILDQLPNLLAVCESATRARFVDAIKATSWWEPAEPEESDDADDQ